MSITRTDISYYVGLQFHYRSLFLFKKKNPSRTSESTPINSDKTLYDGGSLDESAKALLDDP